MINDDVTSFECFHCGKGIGRELFDIAKAFERVDYSHELPCVDVEDSMSLAEYCSTICRDIDRKRVMLEEGVPIRHVGIGPVETCARCGNPVDMSGFHLTYTQNDMTVISSDVFQPTDARYLAVLCRSCAPNIAAQGAEKRTADIAEA